MEHRTPSLLLSIKKGRYVLYSSVINKVQSLHLFVFVPLPSRPVRSGAVCRSARLVSYTRGLGSASPTRPSLPSASTPNVTSRCEHNPVSQGTTLRHLLLPPRLMISSQPGKQRHIAGSSVPNYSANSATIRLTELNTNHMQIYLHTK